MGDLREIDFLDIAGNGLTQVVGVRLCFF